ncbi:MAG: hypothetical protein HFJ41_08915 [Clostridia bacterium]|nr:hypothetical protein [Clostridia bacterium]
MEKGVKSYIRRRSELSHEQIIEIFSRIQFLDYEGIRIRMVEHSGQKWMVFADVCRALGYKNPNHQSKYLNTDEKCHLDIGLKNALTTCINERGLKFFSALSSKESAAAFYEWAVSAGAFTFSK